MPYIPEEDRDRLKMTYTPRTEGELNYLLCLITARYVKGGPLSYARLNSAMGALSGAGREFYRRVVAPYEDRKINENGDVF